MSYELDIKEMARGLRVEESHRGHCPKCKADEEAFIVTRKANGLVFICHRASCDLRGCIRSGGEGYVLERSVGKLQEKPPLDASSFRPLSKADLRGLEGRYGLAPAQIRAAGWLFVPESGRIAMPIWSPRGVQRGWVLRSLEVSHRAKALTYKEVDGPMPSWHGPRGGPVVVVEDIPSAVRAAKYTGAAALIGTTLSTDKVLELLEWSSRVILALDIDATSKAIDYAKKYSWMGNLCVISLSNIMRGDIKDMDSEEEQRYTETLSTMLR